MQPMLVTTDFSIAPFVQIGFYLIAILYALFTAVLYYHWHNYSTDTKATAITYLAYGLTSIPLIFIMAVIAFVIL